MILNWKTSIVLLGIVCGVLAGAAYIFYQKSTNQQIQLAEVEKEMTVSKENASSVEEKLERLSERYNELYKEKNGAANEKLLAASKQLFTNLYEYDTERQEDSVKLRKEKAREVATDTVLNVLFPENAEEIEYSVQTVSKLASEIEVFIKSSDSNQLTALVSVKYSMSIAGSDEYEGTYFYRVEYDQFSNMFTKLSYVTDINILG